MIVVCPVCLVANGHHPNCWNQRRLADESANKNP